MLKEQASIPGKFNMRYIGPYRVIEKKSDVTYKLLDIENKTEYVTHIDRLKPFHMDEPTETDKPVEKDTVTSETTPIINKTKDPDRNEKETPAVNIDPPPADEPVKKKRAKSSKRRSKSLDRPPQQSRYELRRSIKLPAKLKD